ncbi:MAG: aldehyde dehydrogenase family protein [Bacillota bacterium]
MEQPIPRWQVYSPATGELIGEIEPTLIHQTPAIYARARQAFPAWSGLPIEQRLAHFRQLRLLMVEQMESITAVIAASAGKTKVEAITADIMPTLDAIAHMEKYAARDLGQQKRSTPMMLVGRRSYVQYIPRGVVLVISPWNYPLQLAMIPMLSALAAGNTVILKPSEVTPMVGRLIEDLFDQAGFPPGVVQVAHGGKELGAALTAGKPDYIFFTGSVRTGKMIAAQAAKDLIPTTLELGGKDPMIVFQDANLERAVQGAMWGAFTNSGQVCMSVERLYVERPLYERFVARLVEEVKELRQGVDLDDDIGSMTFPGQLDVIKEHLDDALARGARLLTGVKPSDWDHSKGLFVPPMVLVDVKQEMKVVQEESFGPFLPIIPFDSEDEAIRLANDSRFGLNASVWSADLAKAQRVAAKIVAGAVVINDVIVTTANHHLPFGGVKESGWGRYHGEIGLRSFCHEKSVMVSRGSQATELQWYPYRGKYALLYTLFRSYYGARRDLPGFLVSFLKLMRLPRGQRRQDK